MRLPKSERLLRYLPMAGRVCVIAGMSGIAALIWVTVTRPCRDDCLGVALALFLYGSSVGVGVLQLTTSARMQGHDLRWLKPACVAFYLMVIPLLLLFSIPLLLLIPALAKLLDTTRPLGAAWRILRFPLVILGVALIPLSMFGALGTISSLVRGDLAASLILAGGSVAGPGSIMAAIALSAAEGSHRTVSAPA